MSKHSRRQFCWGICAVASSLVIWFTQSTTTAQTRDVEQTQGIWHSTERLGSESRVTVAFRNDGAGIVGWALMLGMQRKTDDKARSEEHTSELQSPCNLVCRLLLEKKKK